MSDTRDDVTEALAEAFRKTGFMATKWAVIAEVIDENGERSLWTLAPTGQLAWDTLGLLEFARQLEQADAVSNILEADE